MKQDFAQQINNSIHSVLNEIHTAMPAKIVAYNNGLVDVKPTLSYKTPQGENMEYPVIYSVPLVLAQSNNCSIAVPIKAGDDCLLIIAEQSMDAWMSNAEEDDTQLRFDLSDAICIPGLSKASVSAQEEANSSDSVVIACGSNKICVSDSSVAVWGNLKVNGSIYYTNQCKQA